MKTEEDNSNEYSSWDDELGDRNKIIPKSALIFIRGTWGYLPSDERRMTEMKDVEITLEKDTPSKEAWDMLINKYRDELLALGATPRFYFFEGISVRTNGIEFTFGT